MLEKLRPHFQKQPAENKLFNISFQRFKETVSKVSENANYANNRKFAQLVTCFVSTVYNI